jgi:hypothetical protein
VLISTVYRPRVEASYSILTFLQPCTQTALTRKIPLAGERENVVLEGEIEMLDGVGLGVWFGYGSETLTFGLWPGFGEGTSEHGCGRW